MDITRPRRVYRFQPGFCFIRIRDNARCARYEQPLQPSIDPALEIVNVPAAWIVAKRVPKIGDPGTMRFARQEEGGEVRTQRRITGQNCYAPAGMFAQKLDGGPVRLHSPLRARYSRK